MLQFIVFLVFVFTPQVVEDNNGQVKLNTYSSTEGRIIYSQDGRTRFESRFGGPGPQTEGSKTICQVRETALTESFHRKHRDR